MLLLARSVLLIPIPSTTSSPYSVLPPQGAINPVKQHVLKLKLQWKYLVKTLIQEHDGKISRVLYNHIARFVESVFTTNYTLMKSCGCDWKF